MLRAVFSTLRFIILILAGHKQVALADDRVMCKNLNECVSRVSRAQFSTGDFHHGAFFKVVDEPCVPAAQAAYGCAIPYLPVPDHLSPFGYAASR